jgi:2-aminoethylphosphonate-pyruvate transaminase
MMIDYGSRDKTFTNIVKSIRTKLLDIGNIDKDKYTTVLIPGSGTYGVESVISSAIPKEGKLAIFSNGAYGIRMTQIASMHNISFTHSKTNNNEIISAETVLTKLYDSYNITHIALVHHETTTGILNPIEEIADAIQIYNKTNNKNIILIVDAMSSYGGIPIDFANSNIDFLISSSNKCIESVPGFSYVIAKKQALDMTKGHERTVSLALYPQWKNMEDSQQFRFTPPTHSLVAFNTALDILINDGGIKQRNLRYAKYNNRINMRMNKMGFKSYLSKNQGCIITTFKYPSDTFDFEKFYTLLASEGIVIYPGKLSDEKVFRIGNIGSLTDDDIEHSLNVIERIYTTQFQ